MRFCFFSWRCASHKANLSVNVAACSSVRTSDGSFGCVVRKALGKNEFVGIIYGFFKYLVGEYVREFSASFMFYMEPAEHNFLLDAFFDPDFFVSLQGLQDLHGLEPQHMKDSNMGKFICSFLWAPRVRYCANAGMLGVTRHFSVWRTVLWNPASGCGVVCQNMLHDVEDGSNNHFGQQMDCEASNEECEDVESCAFLLRSRRHPSSCVVLSLRDT